MTKSSRGCTHNGGSCELLNHRRPRRISPKSAQALFPVNAEGRLGSGKEDCEGARSKGRWKAQIQPTTDKLGFLPIYLLAQRENEMNEQPGLRITTGQGITAPEYLPEALTRLSARQSARKEESRQAAEPTDSISIETVREYFRVAKNAGTWP